MEPECIPVRHCGSLDLHLPCEGYTLHMGVVCTHCMGVVCTTAWGSGYTLHGVVGTTAWGSVYHCMG